MSKNLSSLSGRKGMKYNLFEELGIAAQENGSPDEKEMERLCEEFLFGKASLYGAASFYDFLKKDNAGKKVYWCNGSACMTAGTQEAVKEELSKDFQKEEIGEICCLGRCYENGAVQYKNQNFSGLSADQIGPSLKKEKPKPDSYHVEHLGTPVLTADYGNIESYYQILIKALQSSPEELLEELKISNLRGRGGAGFPIGFKIEACKNVSSDQKFIVCNADEGDPGAYSDRYIMEQRPHSLLMGMIISGYIAGADWGVLYIRAEYPDSVRIIKEAIRELEDRGYCGTNIMGTGFNFYFKAVKAQGSYVCGEETALLSSLEGQRPEVRIRPPYPTEKGLFNKPTVVNNVETQAAIPFIIQNGGHAYASIGNKPSTGTKLLSIDGFFNRPGVYEVDMGTPLKYLIHDIAGGFRKPVKAMHIGGPLGGLVPISAIEYLTIDFESFHKNGFLLGHASIVCIPEDYPMIDYIQHLFEFTSHESCGKCFPCRLGAKRGAEMLEKASAGSYVVDRELMDDLLETLETGSLCALGGGLPLPVKNALQYFEEELSPYFKS